MRTLLFLSLFFSLFMACSEPEMPTVPNTPTNTPPTTSGDSITYLALGDSYTIGESVREDSRFPEKLVMELREANLGVATPHIIARTGWTTDELQAGIAADEDVETTYDMVSLLIGVNNQFRGYPLDEYEVEFEELLNQAIDFAGGDTSSVFVISIPDYAYTPYGENNINSEQISEEIDLFNAANLAITEAKGVLYFDITPISRQGLTNSALVAEDNLHPSEEQYARWVELALPSVRALLEE